MRGTSSIAEVPGGPVVASSPFVNERRHVSKGDFFRQMHALGMQDVTIFHSEGTDVEERIIASAQVQSEKGIFEVDTPIYEGDIVEVGVDPRSGSPDRRLVTHLKINNAPADSHVSSLNHIAVTWGKAPAPRVAEIRRLTIDRLHPEVIAAAGDLFADAPPGGSCRGIQVNRRPRPNDDRTDPLGRQAHGRSIQGYQTH